MSRPRLLRRFAEHWPVVSSTHGSGLIPALAMQWLAAELRHAALASSMALTMEAELGPSYLDAERVPVSVPRLAASLAASSDGLPYLAQADLFEACPSLAPRLLPSDPPWRTPPYRTVAWLGGRTVTPLHRDPYAGLLVQCIGRKECALLPANESVYPFPRHTLQPNTSQVDPFCPDLGAFPDFPAEAVETVVLDEGDALFIPRRWWHSVRTTPDTAASFSLSFWWPRDDLCGAFADGEEVNERAREPEGR